MRLSKNSDVGVVVKMRFFASKMNLFVSQVRSWVFELRTRVFEINFVADSSVVHWVSPRQHPFLMLCEMVDPTPQPF